MSPIESPTPTQLNQESSARILKFVIKLVAAALLVVLGFVLGTYGAMLEERQNDTELPVITFPDSYYGVSSVAYKGGTVLYVLDQGSQCGDHPRYPCEGSFYEITEGRMNKVASDVIGHQVIYYEPGVQALLQSAWGDGSCREIKFYKYDFAAASSTLDFSADNGCEGNDARNDAYEKIIKDYLFEFGL